ncbi:MAG: peptidoglycan-binding domain-containing protein, partial [Kineosporiaceae bacterium]
PGTAPPPPAPYAKPGDDGARVLAVQRLLRVRPLSGHYGPVTQATVRSWQHRHGLPATGVVDAVTAYRFGLGPKPLSLVPTTPVYARQGQSGAGVRAVQKVLGVRPATGYFGPITAAAVKGFQRTHALPQTGVVDHRTAYVLRLVRG